MIGSIVDYLFAPDDPEAVLETLADPATRIVSLTITEGGYNVNPVTGEFDPDDPAVQADLAPGAVPGTVFGLITEALAPPARARACPPFTVMSCDNIQGNGHVARRMFTASPGCSDPELGRLDRARGARSRTRWSTGSPRSPPTRTGPSSRERFGVEDAWPVVCEPFTQWVLEDAFSAGRPPFEDAGVQLVADVEPYELMKLRLLNASHQALCYFGYLAGYRLRPRGLPGPAVRRLPARLHGPGGHADAARRCPASTSTPTSTS